MSAWVKATPPDDEEHHIIKFRGGGFQFLPPQATLPDDGETVLIHTLGGEVWTGFLDGKVWRNVSGARIEEEPVLHWMPLPLPPEDEE